VRTHAYTPKSEYLPRRFLKSPYARLRFKREIVLESQAVNDKNILVLASNSPRRQQLLALGGWSFSILVSDVDESQKPDETPGDYVLRVAEMKAREAAEKATHTSVILAADTTVVDRGDILGKPLDERDATRMLKRLRGHTHQVYTGLALLRVSDGCFLTDLTVTDVPMRNYSDEEIHAYVQTGDPLDKAGAYAIQHPRFHPVENLDGCFASVMGLPLCRLTYLLEQFDLAPESSVGIRCQAELQYDCPISSAILRGDLVNS
jgi:nucleoside triphosphate pyrophosphatase